MILLRARYKYNHNVCELIPKSQIGLCGSLSAGRITWPARAQLSAADMDLFCEWCDATIRADLEGYSATGVWVLGYGVRFLAGVNDFSVLQNVQTGSCSHPAY